jgi:hypothetical protein
MKSMICAAACGLLLVAGQAFAAGDTAVFAPMQQFADGMNAGDMKKAEAAYVPSASIIDEFAPHHWTSFGAWYRDAGAFFKAGGVTDLHIALSAPSDKVVGPNQAYAVVPTTLTSRVKGKTETEKGLFTFALVKTAAGWRISGWAWSTL